LNIVVVDNGSTDGSVPAIRQAFKNIQIITNESNLGFSGGFNVGIKHALRMGADFLVLVNNDATLHPQAIEIMVEAAERDTRIGMLSPVIRRDPSSSRYYWCGGGVDFRNGNADHWKNPPISLDTVGENLAPFETERQNGCVLLVRANVIRHIGLLDERYFLYYEDVEWSVRARKAGYKNVVVPQAKAWHMGSASTGGNGSDLGRYYDYRNRYLFLKTHSEWYRTWPRFKYIRQFYQDYHRQFLYSRTERLIALEAVFSICLNRWGERSTGGGVWRGLMLTVDFFLSRLIRIARKVERIYLLSLKGSFR